jgi:hypothetical protein
MKIKLTTIGKAEIEFDAVSEKQAVESLAFWQGLPQFCGKCASPLVFTFRQPQGFTYYGVECLGEKKHEATFGQHKEGGGLFFKGEWKDVQYGGYIEERNAEIARYDDEPRPNGKIHEPSIGARIEKGIAAITRLGGRASAQEKGETDEEYLESLLAQHERLNKK